MKCKFIIFFSIKDFQNIRNSHPRRRTINIWNVADLQNCAEHERVSRNLLKSVLRH